MKDLERHEKAKALRDGGATYKQVGEALGVSPGRARQMIDDLDRKTRREQQEVEAGVWGRGLDKATRAKVERLARELLKYGWKVEPPGAWALDPAVWPDNMA